MPLSSWINQSWIGSKVKIEDGQIKKRSGDSQKASFYFSGNDCPDQKQ